MGGGGKGGSSSTSTVSIPPEVLARYNSVNAQAQAVAATPFQPYTGQFVAGLTPTQQAGITNTNAAAGMAQPYYGAAVQNIGQAQNVGTAYARGAETAYNQAGQMAQPYNEAATQYTLAGSQGVSPGQLQTGRYFDPYANVVAGSTLAALQQQQGQERNQLAGRQASTGAFGGDRSGLERANLARQQELATAQAISPIYSQAYQNALQTAQQQQGVGLSAAQANRAALSSAGQQLAGIGQQRFGQGMQLGQAYGGLGQQQFGQGVTAGQQIAGIGTAAQQAALQGAQAQLAAGTAEQQTQQADLTAQYQQHLQKQGYPFQVAQFLANIAMGTGALSGSTTSSTSTGGGGIFSDERLKHDVKDIGKTHDGQPIYSYKYNGDDRTQIGLMAQDVEKKHPEAVGVMGGYKTVDYKKATEGAERHHRASGGVIPSSMGGVVTEPGLFALGGHYAGGGMVDSEDLKAIIASQKAALGPFAAAGPYGGSGAPGGGVKGFVPQASLHVPKLVTAQAPQRPNQPSGLAEAAQTGKNISELYKMGKEGLGKVRDWSKEAPAAAGALKGTPAPNAPVPVARPEGLGTDTRTKAAGVMPTEPQTQMAGVVPSGNDNMPTQMASLDNADNFSDFGSADMFAAHGGVVPRAHKSVGGLNIYGTQSGFDYFPEDVMKSGKEEAEQAEGQFKKSTSGGGGGGGGGGGSGLGTIVGMAGLANTAMDLGSSAMEFLPALFVKNGGVIPRHGYQTDGTVVPEATGVVAPSATVDDGGGADEPAKPVSYKIVPQPLEEMPQHRQELIKGIYGPESGGRYDIRYGGEGSRGKIFDPEKGHPNVPELRTDGRTSTAAGAGQFLKSTWDDVTGGAPMTKPYMDSATWELANRDYARRTGRDLDADLKEQGFSPAIKSALSSTWEGLKYPSSGGAKSFGATYSGVNPKEAGFGDVARSFLPESVPTSENFVVPALSFLGSMLASRNPTYGGAIGEGIIGGVSGYMNLQKQEMERAKQVIDFAKDNFTQTVDPATNQTVMYNKMTGQMYSGNDFQAYMYNSLKKAGVDPEIYGIKPPAMPPTPKAAGANAIDDKSTKVAETAASPKTTSTSTTPAPNADKPQENINLMNPGQLRELVINGQIPGGPPDAAARQAQIYSDLARANRMANDPNPTIAQNGIKLRELAQTEQKMLDDKINQVLEYQSKQNNKFAEGRTDRINEYQKEIQTRAATYVTAIANLKRLGELGSQHPTGRGSETAADAVSVLKRFGMENFIPDNWKDIPGGYDQIMKISTAQMLNQLMADKIVRAPQSGLKYEAATVPSPSSDPDNFYALVGNKLGEVLHSQAKDNAWAALPAGSTEPATHELKWPHQKGNELEAFKRQAFGGLPVSTRVNPSELKSLQDSVRDKETGETFTPRVQSGTTTQAAPAPQIPTIKSDAEYNALKSGMTYIAPDGSTRRKP